MKPEVKKLILLNLPYLLFVYLFGKVGQAFRLAHGIDLSAKLLHIGQGFTTAFSSAAPSFSPHRSANRHWWCGDYPAGGLFQAEKRQEVAQGYGVRHGTLECIILSVNDT